MKKDNNYIKRVMFITDSNKKLSGGLKQLYLNMLGLQERKYTLFLASKASAGIRNLSQSLISGFFPLDFTDYKLDGRKLGDFIESNKIDIVHTFHNKGHKVGLWAKKYNPRFKLFVNRGVDFVPTNVFYYLHPKINGFICNSHSVANKLRKIFIPDNRINVLYNAFTTEGDFHENTKDSEFIDNDKMNICTIASGTKWKGFDYTLKSINYTDSDFNFYVLGIENKEKYIDMLSPKAAEKTIWLGRRKDIVPTLSEMDLFVYTPVGGDSCPNVILEAMYAGLPVISTNVGGIPELIVNGKGGMIVKKKDYKSVSEKIEFLLNDRARRMDMGSFNKHRISVFSLERKIDELLKIYNGENVKENL